MGLGKITVSVHSIRKEKYCEIFGVSEDEYEQAMSNIKMLIKTKAPFSIAVTVSSKNFDEMDEIKNHFVRLGHDENQIFFNMFIQGRSDIRNYRDGSNFRDYISSHKGLKDNTLTKGNGFLCSAGRIACSINPYGDVLPCTFFNSIAGNLFESSITEIWEKSHLFKMIRSSSEKDFHKCASCEYNEYCHVCMANNLNETGLYHTPSSDYCSYRYNLAKTLLEA